MKEKTHTHTHALLLTVVIHSKLNSFDLHSQISQRRGRETVKKFFARKKASCSEQIWWGQIYGTPSPGASPSPIQLSSKLLFVCNLQIVWLVQEDFLWQFYLFHLILYCVCSGIRKNVFMLLGYKYLSFSFYLRKKYVFVFQGSFFLNRSSRECPEELKTTTEWQR